MLNLVRNNSPYTAILLFIFTLCLNLQGLGHAILPKATDHQLVYGWVLEFCSFFFGKSAFAFSFFTVLLLYAQALFLNAVIARFRLYQHNTYLVSFSFIALSSLHPALSNFSPLLLVNILVLLAINELLQLKQSQHVNKELFNLGFLIMLAALIHFSAILLVLFLFSALLILRPFNFREWMISLVGLLMPLYILLVVLFWMNKFSAIYLWPDLGISLPSQLLPAHYYLGLFIGFIVWFSVSVYNMQLQLPKAPIYIRRYWISLTFLLMLSALSAIFSDNHINAVWVICLPALSLVMANAFLNERSKKMNIISFYFALALVLFCQIFLPL